MILLISNKVFGKMFRIKTHYLILFSILLIVNNFAQRKIVPKGRNEEIKSRISRITKNKVTVVKKRANINRKRKTIPAKKRIKRRKKRYPNPTTQLIKEYNPYDDNCHKEFKEHDMGFYASVNDSNIKEEEIFPYPNFPLVLSNVKINYLYTENTFDENDDNIEYSDIYKLIVTVKVLNDDYLKPFGISINYTNGFSLWEVFNLEESILYWNKSYTFIKEISLPQNGYVNLRIGYYDSELDKFYPCKYIPEKTDFLVYVN